MYKKIIFIPEFDAFGGTRTFFKRIIRFYIDNQINPIICLTERQLDNEIRNLITKEGLRHYIIPDRPGNLGNMWFHFPFNIVFDYFALIPVILKEKPDGIVISNSTPGQFLGLIRLTRAFMYILHTYPSRQLRPSIRKMFINYLNRRKLLLTVSQFSRKNILYYWLNSSDSQYVRVIYNTVEEKPVLKKEDQFKKISVLTLGTVVWYKNPEIWIEVARRVVEKMPDQVDFIWAGDGPLLEGCRNQIERLKLTHVKFIGFQNDIDALYTTGDVYFQPSKMESHGIAVVGAMMRGLPCVVSNVGGLPESIIDNETGFIVEMDNVEQMADRLCLLLKDSSLRERLGINGRERYFKYFTPDIWEREMLKLHQQLGLVTN